MLPGEKSFEQISRSIVHVETKWSVGTATATGFIVGRMRNSTKLVIATAKHVVDYPKNATVSWRVRQFDPAGKIEREQSFGTNAEQAGDVPYRTHNALDLAVFFLPSFSDSNEPFARKDEQPIRLLNPEMVVATGSRVAWAGFPGIVEAALGFPQLCYFEGSVSATICRDDGRIHYIVDGHATRGVSGGPVWHWCEEQNRLEVIGVVSSYHSEKDLPGFCFFEPINHVIGYLRHWRAQVKDDELIFVDGTETTVVSCV